MDPFSFYDQVYQILRQIPKGRVTSYGAIASYLGSKGSARMVGFAMNASHTAYPPVPAQRVVNRNGMLTGKFHFGSAGLMQQLLENDGIKVKNDQVLDFRKIFWDPSIECKIDS